MSGHDTPPPVDEDHGPPPGTPKPLDLDGLAPTFAGSYGLSELEKDSESELVSVERLPSWNEKLRGAPPSLGRECLDGHGMGKPFSKAMGDGLRPGEMIAIGAAAAGAGKTAWLMQLVDGLALRNERVLAGEEATWGKVLTPVLVASEMSIEALTWRSLARWTGHPSTIFRGGKTLRESPRTKSEASQAWAAARAALASSASLGASRTWLRLVNATHVGALLAGKEGNPRALVFELERIVEAWRDQLAKKHPSREVVPIVVLDPTQRYQGGDDAVEALNELSRSLCTSTVEKRWITLVTSDTNKNAATGKDGDKMSDSEGATAAFRGSYNLMHEVTAAFILRPSKAIVLPKDEQEKGVRVVEAVFAKQRWGSAAQPGPHFLFDGPTMRFFPMTREETEKRLREAANERDASKDRAQTKGAKPSAGPKVELDE